MAIRQPNPQRQPFPVSKYHGRRMTEAQFLTLPEEKPYLEYIDGMVLQKPMANSAHRILVRYLDYLLHGYIMKFGGDGGPEGRVRMPDGSGYRLPDTAYWVPGRPSGDDTVPSLAVEVRSPDQTLAGLRRKCRAFRSNGVDACWLIDPVSRTVEVFEGERDGEVLSADGVLSTSVMPDFELPIQDLFAVLKS